MAFNIKKHKEDLLFVPLGGSGEIGMNFNLYQYKGKWLIIDCGAGFAEDLLPGVDIIVPDISFILENKDKLLGIVLTHCHEDHFGAVQYLWDMLECPIYATTFTSSFLKGRLKDNNIRHASDIYEIPAGGSLDLDPFKIEMVPLCHSAPEMQALVIKTEVGNIFHTGDWKFDDDPVLGDANDEKLLKRYGDEGVLAVIGDSTNVFKEDYSGSEGKLKKSLLGIVKKSSGMVIVTTFASNLARLQALLEIAKKLKKKVVIAGKSLHRVLLAAKDCGYLEGYFDLIIDDRNIGSHKRENIMVIATGCQGEPLAAVTKIANESHRTIKITTGDTVIFSSKIIPGNDKKLFRVFNKLVQKRINVLTEKDHFVHVSGHPSKKELTRLYNLLRPQALIPVHGEHVHMHEHAKLGEELGIKHVVEVENGDVVALSKNSVAKIDKVQAGVFGIYGNYFLSADCSVMKMRRRIQNDGIFIVNLSLSKNNKLLSEPMIFAPGYIDEKADIDLINYIKREIDNLVKYDLQKSKKKGAAENVNNHVRSLIKSILKKEVGKVPEVKILSQVI